MSQFNGSGGPGGAMGGGRTGTGSKINESRSENDDRKIFVGGLSRESTIDDMKRYFGKFGSVLDATLKTDQATGRSRGFGFVLFADSDSVDRVFAEKNHMLHNKTIDPKRAVANGGAGSDGIKKIFVGGLDPNLTEQDITDHFSTYGKVELVELPYDKSTNQRRAFGFITFESADTVAQICSNSKIAFGDKMLDVKKAESRSGPQNGGRGGRGGMMSRGRGRGGFAPEGGYGGDGYGHSGSYQGGYPPSYDYYGQSAGGYPPSGAYGGGGGYGNASHGWGEPYGQPGGSPGYGYPPAAGYGGGYEYSSGWSGDDSAYGKAKGRGGAAPVGGGAYSSGGGGYHPYNR